MELAIVSAGLSAALIDKDNKTQCVEALMRFEVKHQAILLVPKNTANPNGIAKSRLIDKFSELKKRLRRDLSEQFFGTHDAYDMDNVDMWIVGTPRSQGITLTRHDIAGGCNDEWDWRSTEWIANMNEASGVVPQLVAGALQKSQNVAATLKLSSGTLTGYRPIEPVSKPKTHKLKARNQRFTDAMRWSESYANCVFTWKERGMAETATLTFDGTKNAEMLLLNLPKPGHGGGSSHFKAFSNLPFVKPITLPTPLAASECDALGGERHSEQHSSEGMFRMSVEGPATLLATGEAVLRFSVNSAHDIHERLVAPDLIPLGDSLCMRMIGEVDNLVSADNDGDA